MIHLVYANRSNVGDWLSARGIRALLREELVTEHLCDEPFAQETLAALSALGPEGRVVIGGGGLFMDYFEPFWTGFLELAESLRFCIWGAGCVDLKREDSLPPLRLIEKIASCARVCRVRDEWTRGLLSGVCLPDPVPCPSIVAVKPQQCRERGILHSANYTTVGAEAYEAMRSYGQEFAAETGRVFRETNNRIEPGSEQSLAETLLRYARSDMILTSRLHGCIIGLAMGRRVLAVSGDHKVDAFMRAAGLSEWVLAFDELDRLPESLHELHNQKPATCFIEGATAANRVVAREVLEALSRS